MTPDEVREIVRDELALWHAAQRAAADQKASATQQYFDELRQKQLVHLAENPADGPLVREIKAMMRRGVDA